MTIDLLTNPENIVTPIKPLWFITAQLNVPLGKDEIDAFELAMAMSFILRLQVNLYDVFNRKSKRKRSIQEDQLEVFRQIEDNLSMTGMDGHACVLRFICELQHNRFSGSSIFGELFTLMFTPKQGQDYTILKEYIEAEMRGQDALTSSEISKDVCSQHYGSCVWSVFDALRKLVKTRQSTIADRPQNYTNKLREDLGPHHLNEI